MVFVFVTKGVVMEVVQCVWADKVSVMHKVRPDQVTQVL